MAQQDDNLWRLPDGPVLEPFGNGSENAPLVWVNPERKFHKAKIPVDIQEATPCFEEE
jgi:hypothetical protein